MLIYKVTNKIDGKCYIGKTTQSLESRKEKHLKNVRNGKTTKFYNAIKKYGVDNFSWETLEISTDTESLNLLEKKYILEYDSFKYGYNMTTGGEGGDTISHKTQEEKSRQGAKPGNIPWNKGMDMKSKGYTFTNRKSRSRFSEEQKKAHSVAIKQSVTYKTGLLKRVPAKQNMIEDEFGNIWNTQKEWATEVGITTHYKITKVLAGTPHNGVRYFIRSKK